MTTEMYLEISKRQAIWNERMLFISGYENHVRKDVIIHRRSTSSAPQNWSKQSLGILRKHSLPKIASLNRWQVVQLPPADNPTRRPGIGRRRSTRQSAASGPPRSHRPVPVTARRDPCLLGPARHRATPTGRASPTSPPLGPAPHPLPPRPRHVTAEIINFRPFTTSFPKRPSVRYLLSSSSPSPPPLPPTPLLLPSSPRRPHATARDTGQRPGWWRGGGRAGVVCCSVDRPGRTRRGAAFVRRAGLPWGGTGASGARGLLEARGMPRARRRSQSTPPTTGWWRRSGTARTPSCTARSSCPGTRLWRSSAWISISSITTSWAPATPPSPPPPTNSLGFRLRSDCVGAVCRLIQLARDPFAEFSGFHSFGSSAIYGVVLIRATRYQINSDLALTTCWYQFRIYCLFCY